MAPGQRSKIDDAEWFELQFQPEIAKSKYGIDVPGFPTDTIQITFTGLAGRANLEQAFKFYLLARDAAALDKLDSPRIMDFGAGWGRIARFFLRDARPEDIVAVDTLSLAVHCLRNIGCTFQVIHNPPAPPIPEFHQTFDLIYAYSVFSHLSETYSRAWLDYLLTRLNPGGHLVITTRGERFINDLTTIKAQTDEYINSLETAGVGKYMKWMRENFPDPTIIRDRFRKGEFLFFPVENKMHIEDCTGETLIPETYFKQH